MYKSIIKLLDKASPSQSDVSLAWSHAKKLDKGLDWRVWRSIKGRNEYLTKIMAKATQAIEDKLAFNEMKRMRDAMDHSSIALAKIIRKTDAIIKA